MFDTSTIVAGLIFIGILCAGIELARLARRINERLERDRLIREVEERIARRAAFHRAWRLDTPTPSTGRQPALGPGLRPHPLRRPPSQAPDLSSAAILPATYSAAPETRGIGDTDGPCPSAITTLCVPIPPDGSPQPAATAGD